MRRRRRKEKKVPRELRPVVSASLDSAFPFRGHKTKKDMILLVLEWLALTGSKPDVSSYRVPGGVTDMYCA